MYSSEKSVESILENGYEVKIGQYLQRGFELFKQNIGGFIGFAVVLVLFSLVTGFLQEKAAPLGSILQLIVGGPLTAGFFIVAFKKLKNQETAFADFFLGFSNFLPYFLVNLLSSIFIAIGIVLLIVPGIYLSVAYTLAVCFVAARNFDFWEAMESSRKVVTKNWFSFFAFGIVLVLINFAGALVCGIGLLATVPISFCAIAAAFEDIVGLPQSV